MVSIIERIDQKAGDRLVYSDDQCQYTYQDLKEKSDHIAYYLAKHFPNRAPVVVYGGLQFEMLAFFLGAVKSGHAYIPIESHTPSERIRLILQTAQPACILAVDDFDSSIALDMQVLSYNEVLQQPIDETLSLEPVTKDENFYIIFTSGTTGVPKGVQISHDNLVSFVDWELKDFQLPNQPKFLSQAPYTFDLSVMSIYPALCAGGALMPLAKEIVDDFKALFAHLPKLGINVWVSTPSFVDICLMAPEFDGQHLQELTHFIFCGEELTKQTAQKLLDRFPNAKVFNTYGPTEATVAISQIQITQDIIDHSARLQIGYVKEDCRVVILDEGKEQAVNEVGEIVIVGPSVSKGYMNNPEKTKEAFITYQGQPAYKTGDAGSLDENGLLHYNGRIDFQVKLHGFRMELEDIDHHLMKVSYVDKATVVPKYKDHKVQQLVAFVVAKENDFAKEFELTKAIKAELAQTVMDYMIPQRFVYVKELPRTANGKIDRKGLMNEVNT